MNSSIVTLSLFLLFSPLDSMQDNLFYAVTGNQYSVQDELALKKEVELSYEDAIIKATKLGVSLPSLYYLDKEQELMTFLNNDEDGIELNNSIENPLYGEQSESSPLINQVYLAQDDESLNIGEILYRTNDLMLRLLRVGSEDFLYKINSSKSQTIYVNDDLFVRYISDDNYHVIEKDVFKNASSFSDIYLKFRTYYDYENNYLFKTSYEDFENKKVIVTTYKNKNPISVETYLMKDFDVLQFLYIDRVVISDFLLESSILREFNSENKIISEEVIKYDYSKKDFPEKKISKNVFTYTDKSSNPNYKYYENGVLCLEVKYSDEKSYVEYVYFSNKYEIRNRYINGKKVSEVYYEDGKEIRRRSF